VETVSSTTSNANAPVLVFEDVYKSFLLKQKKIHALKGVTFQVKPGIVTGLIGLDGAGKTTLMRLATGLLIPDKGKIETLGVNITSDNNDSIIIQSKIGYMPQRFGLYEDLTVQENMDLFADLQGIPVSHRRQRYDSLLHMAGLKPFTSRLAGRLSGGMKQKLGLICTLVSRPEFLLLDEPTVGVDPVSRRELWQIIYHLVDEEKASVLISTSYLDEAERCAEVLLMHKGKIIGQDKPSYFTNQVQGRTFLVKATGMSKRNLQQILHKVPGVIDAIIFGSGVRLVTESDFSLPDAVKNKVGELHIEPIAPRFEDGFMALLKSIEGEKRLGTSSLKLTKKKKDTDHSDKKVIVVKNLSRKFGDFYAVKNISFYVKKAEVFGLLGANGAGKTTTFRMLCGLLPVSEGIAEVAGTDMRTAPSEARSKIGYMAQRFSLYGNLTVMQNLKFFSTAYGLAGKRRKERVKWAIDSFALGPYVDQNSEDLPLGFKQRLALAAALMHEPEILFLDEPTSGVDPFARREFWDHINQLAENGVTILVTTHFMEEAEFCDRIVIMANGQILTIGSPEEIKAQARTKDLPEPTLEDAFIALLEKRTEIAEAA